jgi:hypothetical protein
MARVRVDDETWREFRRELGPNTVAKRLGELVKRDLGERRRRRLDNGQLDPREVQQALEQAAELGRDLAAITRRLEALAGAQGRNERSEMSR